VQKKAGTPKVPRRNLRGKGNSKPCLNTEEKKCQSFSNEGCAPPSPSLFRHLEFREEAQRGPEKSHFLLLGPGGYRDKEEEIESCPVKGGLGVSREDPM